MSDTTQSAQGSVLRRAEISVMIAVFVTVFATPNRLARLPLRSLIKDDLGLPPEAMAEIFALIGVAWYVKPIAAVLSDQLPLAGSRRKHYLMLSALAGAATWVATAFVSLQLEMLILALALVNVTTVLGNSVTGGLLVDAGREHGATGKLSTLRVFAMNTGSFLVGPIGGWLASRQFPVTAGVGASLMVGMVVVVAMSVSGDVLAPERAQVPVARRFGQALALVKQRRIWSVSLFTGLVYLAPSFGSLLYYHQRSTLEFSDQTIGLLASLNCLGGMLAVFLYFRGSTRFKLRSLIVVGALSCAFYSLSYLFYDSLTAAIFIEPFAGFALLIGILPIQELTARASPPRHEAFGFAVILSICNAAIAMSDVIGTRLAARFDLTLDHLIVINAISLLLPLALLPLVPASLLDKKEAPDPQDV